MNAFTKAIRKLMGWCLNTKIDESEKNINSENFNSDNPNIPVGENGVIKPPKWSRKLSTRILFADIFFTLAYSLIVSFLGVNLIFLLAGFLIALFLSIFDWNTQMRRYDSLLKEPVFESSNKMKMLLLVLITVLILDPFYDVPGLTLQSIYSFGGGSLIYMWLSYFQLINWEKKNNKIIYFDKSCGIWKKSYMILEKK